MVLETPVVEARLADILSKRHHELVLRRGFLVKVILRAQAPPLSHTVRAPDMVMAVVVTRVRLSLIASDI